MIRVRAVTIAILTLAIGAAAAAQERFLFDNLSYTTSSAVGPVTFSESQFPVGTVLNGKSVSALNATNLAAPLSFAFIVFGGPSVDATVKNLAAWNPILSGPQGRMVEGTTAGTIAIDFGATATLVEFDFALLSYDFADIDPGCTITAFNASGSQVASLAVPAPVAFFYPEGHASLRSTTGFRRIEIRFASPFPDRIPTLDGWGLAVLALLVAAAGALLSRRTLA